MSSPTTIRTIVILVFLVILGGCGTHVAPPPSEDSTPLAPAQLATSSESLEMLRDLLDAEGYRLAPQHASTVEADGVSVTTVPIEGTASSLTYTVEDDAITSVQYSVFTTAGEALSAWPVCHVPAGNPASAHTIHVDYPALQAHVGRHGGDTIGPCPANAGTDAAVNLTTVVLASGLPAIVTEATLDTEGEVVILDVGEAVGTTSLAELTTIRAAEPPPPRDTTMPDFVAFLVDVLGEDAQPILDNIPESMGGQGPELAPEESIITPYKDVPCLPGECEEDPPSGGDPTDPGDDDDGDPSDPGGDGPDDPPSEGDPDPTDGESDPSDDDPNPSDGDGPSYDPDRLAELEGDVTHWQTTVSEIEGVIAGIDADLDQAREDFDIALATVHEIVHEAERPLTEIAMRLEYVERGITTVEGDINDDLIGIALGATGVAIGCVGSVTGWGILSCAGGAGALDVTLGSYKGHRQEKRQYESEKAELEEERDQLLAEAEGAILRSAEIRDEVIPSLEESKQAAEGLLVVAEDELARAEDALHDFEVTHGLD